MALPEERALALELPENDARPDAAIVPPARASVLLVVLLVAAGGLVLLAVTATALVPAPALAQHLTERLLPPTRGHVAGTDALGRDVLAQLVLGARWSLPVGALATLLGAAVGAPVGIAAGWKGGTVEAVLMRLVDAATAFPFMVLAVAIIAVLHRGFVPLVVTLGLGAWLIFARTSYVESKRVGALPYIEAARALGTGELHQVFRHVLPNISSALIVVASFTFADLVIAESGLSFLGLGAPPGVPSWGVMLADGRNYMERAWWLTVAPACAIAFTVIIANFLGDSLEVALNPRRDRG